MLVTEALSGWFASCACSICSGVTWGDDGDDDGDGDDEIK